MSVQEAHEPAPRDARPRPRRRRVLALALGLVLALVGAELGTRLLGLGVPARGARAETEPLRMGLDPAQVPDLSWTLRPESQLVAHYPGHAAVPEREVEYRINAQGLRDRPFEPHKPRGRLRIAVLGDSFTFGTGVDLDETLPKALERRLLQLAPELSIEVLNAGVFNYNALQYAAFLKARVADFEPDLVLLCFYINDASGEGVPKEAEADGWEAAWVKRLGLSSGVWAAGEETSAAQYVTMALRRRSELADLVCFRLHNWLHGRVSERNYRANWIPVSAGFNSVRHALRDCLATASARDFDLHATMYPDLAGLDSVYPYGEAHALLQRACETLQVPFHDVVPALSGWKSSSLWAHPHDHHPSARCHELVAERLADGLLPALRARAQAAEQR